MTKYLVQLRRGTLEEWDAANPVLRKNEIGYILDTKQYKVGDGISPWKTLPGLYPAPFEYELVVGW